MLRGSGIGSDAQGGLGWSRLWGKKKGKTAGSLTLHCAPPHAASGGPAEEQLPSRGPRTVPQIHTGIRKPPRPQTAELSLGGGGSRGSSGLRPTLAHVFPPRTDTRMSLAKVFPRPGASQAPMLS